MEITGAGIPCAYARYSTFENNYLHGTGGIYLDDMSEYNLVDGNIIAGNATGSHGVLIAGPHNSIRKNAIYAPLSYGISLIADGVNRCDSNLVYNNTVFGCNRNLQITVDNTDTTICSIEHNRFSNNIFYASTSGTEITVDLRNANTTHNWMKADSCASSVTDNADDSSWGSNRFWYNDIFYDTRCAAYPLLVKFYRDTDCAMTLTLYQWSLYDIATMCYADSSWIFNLSNDPVITSITPAVTGYTSEWWVPCKCSGLFDKGIAVVDTIGTHVEALHTGYGWAKLVSAGLPDVGVYEKPSAAEPEPVPDYYDNKPPPKRPVLE